MAYNQDAWRMVEEKVTAVASAAQSAATTAATEAAATALAALYAGSGETLPTTATATVGQLFIKTGTSAGLYVCTAATTSASTWTAVATAS